MAKTATRRPRPEPGPKDAGTRLLLLIGLLLQLLMMAAGLWPAMWLILRYAGADASPTRWVLVLLGAVLLFNYGYLLALLLLRIIIPYPKEGSYPVVAEKGVPKQVVIFMLNLLLLKSRFDPPWAAMFSSVLTRIHPLRVPFTRLFGPRTSTTTPGDTFYCLDPHLVEIGRNVQMGFQCTIAAHLFDNRKLIIRKVVIEDNAAIGGQAGILPGVRVGHHAVVAGRAHVQPNTIIGPYEYWAGDPARKVRDLTPAERRQVAAEQ